MSLPFPSPRLQTSRLLEAATTQARLRIAPRRPVPAPRVPFVVLVVAVLLGGIGGLLMFNTSMQQASFTASALEARATSLEARQQTLQMRIEDQRDPQRVARLARAQGMVPAGSPAFLRLRDGAVLGEPTPATSLDAMRIEPLPAPKPADLLATTTWVKPDPASAPSTDSATSAGRKTPKQKAKQEGSNG